MCKAKRAFMGMRPLATPPIRAMRPRGESASDRVIRYVGQCGKHRPHATQRLASAISKSEEISDGRSEGFMITSAEEERRRLAFNRRSPAKSVHLIATINADEIHCVALANPLYVTFELVNNKLLSVNGVLDKVPDGNNANHFIIFEHRQMAYPHLGN